MIQQRPWECIKQCQWPQRGLQTLTLMVTLRDPLESKWPGQWAHFEKGPQEDTGDRGLPARDQRENPTEETASAPSSSNREKK